MKKMLLQSIIVGVLLSLTTLTADEALKQKVSIYGWLPTLDGNLRFSVPGEADESTDASAIDSLDAVFMGSYEIQKDKWSFLADAVYVKVSGNTEGVNPNVNLDIELTAKIFGLYGGYTLSQEARNQVDIIGGMRYFGLDLDVKRTGGLLSNRTLSPSVDNYDAVIGLKGSHSIDENWYIPYLVDIGAGDSDLTWQASLSIAYRMDWGDIIGTYRYIHYESEDSLATDFDLYGPKIGVVFHL